MTESCAHPPELDIGQILAILDGEATSSVREAHDTVCVLSRTG